MTQLHIFKRKLPQLDFKKDVNLDIGCGPKKEKDFIGVDVRDCGQDIIWDVREGIPLPDGSVDKIWTSHFLEHLTDQESKDFLRECYRVLYVGGLMQHLVPHQEDPAAYYFDHKTFWNEHRAMTVNTLDGLSGFKMLRCERLVQPDERHFTELIFLMEKEK
jgi:predicted SAM-dependent methyltransferase